VAQKYQLEAIGAPLVPTHVFFDEKTSLEWIEQTTMPKVFKLRRGAGSLNVRLVRTPEQGKALIKKAFRTGFKPMGAIISDQIEKKLLRGTIGQRIRNLNKIRKLPALVQSLHTHNKHLGLEIGYVYFQDFVPDNTHDTRITVMGDHHLFGFLRDVRDNDFRASGSGKIRYDQGEINPKCIEIGLDVAKKLGTQSIVLDFVEGKQHQPLIAEISYGFVPDAVYECPGYWDSHLQRHEGHIWPQDLIVEDLIEAIQRGAYSANGK
jgi:glutathione synthase/RimK-type ligase-like ATP-grasp enzyme